MTNDTRRCYGRMHGKLEQCANCAESPWCGQPDAHDPPPIGVKDSVPDAEERLPDREPTTPDPVREAAEMCRNACVLVLDSADWNAVRIAVCMARCAGLSYAEIGARLQLSKQAVQKHIAEVAKVNPAFAEYLAGKAVAVEALRMDLDHVIDLERAFGHRLREETRWMKRVN